MSRAPAFSRMRSTNTSCAAIAPLITGIAAFGHWSPFGMRYEGILAIHILSVELLMVWMPFGKIFHVITSLIVRFRTGAAFSRRGVRA